MAPIPRRLVRALGVIAPSAVAACAGALVTGAIEGSGGALHRTASAGLVAVMAMPVLLVASLVVRGLLRAWQPRALLDGMREDRGAMPRLAAWVGVVWLAALALAWAMFQGTWLVATWTAFKPNVVGFLQPMLAVLTVLVIVALSRPCADLFTWIARKLDRQWQRFAPGTLLSPWVILIGAMVTAVGVGYLFWALLVSRRLGDRELGIAALLGPLAGVATTIAVHVAWRGPRLVRGIAGGLIGAATIAAIATASYVAHDEPAIAIAIWADEPIGRIAIEQLFDVEAIRRELPLDAFRPVTRTSTHPDIVLITFDDVRADHTPVYGGTAQMPALADLGEHGAVFRSAFAPSPLTVRSIPSLLTGLAVNRVRSSALWLDPRHVVLAERLHEAGYETAAFTCCAQWSEDARTGWARGLDQVTIDADLPRLGYAAREWIAKRERTPTKRPLLLWVHLQPAWAREGSTDERSKRYDRALAAVDVVLADIEAAFATRSAERTPIFVVTSMRGEDLGERDHGSDELSNGQIRIPLIIAGPGVKPQAVTETVSLIDVMPTIIDLAGYQAPRGVGVDGRSLSDITTGRRRADSPTAQNGVAFAAVLAQTPDEHPQLALIRGSWKLVDAGPTVELYDLHTDPDEHTNLAGQRMQMVSELRALLAVRLKAAQQPPF